MPHEIHAAKYGTSPNINHLVWSAIECACTLQASFTNVDELGFVIIFILFIGV